MRVVVAMELVEAVTVVAVEVAPVVVTEAVVVKVGNGGVEGARVVVAGVPDLVDRVEA